MMGTPLEDSFRRDFTMNALYYHLHTCRIEDWTRQGLHDLLHTRQVVTPLDAYQTFHDDPLRVLRAIRFAVRYGLRLSDDVQRAARHVTIHDELHRKVSRERVGKELEGMLSGKHAQPIQALTWICDLKLAGSVFCLPSSAPPPPPPPGGATKETTIILGTIGQAYLEPVPYRGGDDDDGVLAQLRHVAWKEARECLRVLPPLLLELFPTTPNDEGCTTTASTTASTSTTTSTTTVDNRLLYLAVVLLPFEHLEYYATPPTTKNNNNAEPNNNNKQTRVKFVAEYMMREGIKFKNKDAVGMVTLSQQLDSMVQLLQRSPEEASLPKRRLQVGLLLRATKDLWVTLLMVATVALTRKTAAAKETSTTTTTTTTTTKVICWSRRAKEWYHMIVDDLELDHCWTLKPHLNGKELMQSLGLPKGPQVGIYTQEQMRWILINPKGTLEECTAFLKGFHKHQEHEQDVTAQHISKKMHL
jgi:tRNA nucleotidyltransferase (CCA-adding enzyme)